MKKILTVTIVLLIALFLQVFPALAWEDCPFGLVNDPYPGSCPRYIDTNNDGICDHSQSAPTASPDSSTASIPTSTSGESPLAENSYSGEISVPQTGDQDVPTYAQSLERLSLLPLGELKALTVQRLSETYSLPAEPLISVLALKGISADKDTSLNTIIKAGSFSRTEFLAFLGEVYSNPESLSSASPVNTPSITLQTNTPSTVTSSTPTLPAAASQKSRPSPPWWRKGEVFALFSTLILILALKGLTWAQKRSRKKFLGWFTLKNYHFALNLILLASFALSFLSGFLDYLSLTFHLFPGWGKTIVALHFDSSFVMLLVGAIHAFWHIPYYRGCLAQTGKLWRKNKKTFWKWALNIVLTLSFAISLLSGLLNYLALQFRWLNIVSPSLEVHIYSSLVMMGASLLHTLWHLSYYKRYLGLPRASNQKKSAAEVESCPVS